MSQQGLQSRPLERLRQCAPVQRINQYMESPWFVLSVCLLTVCANLFGAELYVYTAFILCGIYISLLGRDFLPLIGIVISCYIAPSTANNPGRNESSIFYPQNGGIYLAVLLLILIGCIVFRLATDPVIGKKAFLRKKRSLTPGMLVLGLGYVLAGAFSGRYFAHGINNLAFAVVQFISVFLMYWFFSGSVRWERVRTDYLAWIGLGVGLTVCCELVGVFISEKVIVDNTIHTPLIASGWGNANNMGCMVAMMIPFAVDLSHRSRYGWVYSTIGVLMIGFVCFTCSRTSMFVAVLIYIISMALALQDPRRRKDLLIANGVAGILLLGLLIFHGAVGQLFAELIARGFNPRLRDIIFVDGFNAFLKKPIFGDSFYPGENSIYQWSTLESFRAILPARWHNTIIQLLASCGIVGFGCYSFHRIQTIRLFWNRRRTDCTFIALSLMAMLMMSMLDCHFFNVGPVLFYSMALAFAENVFPTIETTTASE